VAVEQAMQHRETAYDELAHMLMGIESAIQKTVEGQMQVFGSAGHAR